MPVGSVDHPEVLALPIAIDLGATVLFSITGAMLAIRRHYDAVGVFVMALACGLGGGLLRDGLFIQSGPPMAMRDGSYIIAVLVGCVFGRRLLQSRGAAVQAIPDYGCAWPPNLRRRRRPPEPLKQVWPFPRVFLLGVVNAVGSGLIRDVLVREEPLMLKPGGYYVIASLLGVVGFVVILK